MRVTILLAGRDTFICLKADGIVEDDKYIRAFKSNGNLIAIIKKEAVKGCYVTTERKELK